MAPAARRDALRAQQLADGLRRLRALREPVAHALLVDRDRRRVGLRVVVPDRLDHATVALRALVGDDDPPDRILARANAGKPQSYSHCRPSLEIA
jgi:hypothetical protein